MPIWDSGGGGGRGPFPPQRCGANAELSADDSSSVSVASFPFGQSLFLPDAFSSPSRTRRWPVVASSPQKDHASPITATTSEIGTSSLVALTLWPGARHRNSVSSPPSIGSFSRHRSISSPPGTTSIRYRCPAQQVSAQVYRLASIWNQFRLSLPFLIHQLHTHPTHQPSHPSLTLPPNRHHGTHHPL